MKKIVLFLSISVLSLACIAKPAEADEKWLGAVQKMVSTGKTEVSTPSQERVDLLKTWAAKNGYAADVTRTSAGFKVELSRQLASK